MAKTVELSRRVIPKFNKTSEIYLMGIKDFYNSGIGNLLIDSSKFPDQIHSCLEAEINFLDAIIGNYDLIIEVGCMQGRYLEFILRKNKYYLGIDIAPNYIVNAKKKANILNIDQSKYDFICQSINNLDIVLKQSNFDFIPQNNTIAFFPFNSFGNLEDIEGTISCLDKVGISFYISSYKTNEYSTQVREEYYNNCQYTNIIKANEIQGVRFTSPEGLNTIAYHPHWLVQQFKRNGINIQMYDLDKVGIAYIFEHHL